MHSRSSCRLCGPQDLVSTSRSVLQLRRMSSPCLYPFLICFYSIFLSLRWNWDSAGEERSGRVKSTEFHWLFHCSRWMKRLIGRVSCLKLWAVLVKWFTTIFLEQVTRPALSQRCAAYRSWQAIPDLVWPKTGVELALSQPYFYQVKLAKTVFAVDIYAWSSFLRL